MSSSLKKSKDNIFPLAPTGFMCHEIVNIINVDIFSRNHLQNTEQGINVWLGGCTKGYTRMTYQI